MVDGITFGYSTAKYVATSSTTELAVRKKAMPSLPRAFATSAPTKAATTAIASVADSALPVEAMVQLRNAPDRTIVTTPRRVVSSRASCRMPGGLQRDEDRSVGDEHREHGQTAEDGVRREEVENRRRNRPRR